MARIWNKHKQSNAPLKRKVFVGMSGGVDSSVAAALLQKDGFDVTGVFIKVWQPDFVPCPWREERLDAMRVAAHLRIPFVTFDFEKEYKQHVVDYMVAEYKDGRTPNPDVMCNKSVKFGVFLDRALQMGADFVATGHYARTNGHGLIKLLAGIDDDKDQTYFLWTLTQKQLQHLLFPIGLYKKVDVRALARDFGLSTADKKDSQGVCFMGKLDMKEFLKHFVDASPGKVLDERGDVIGSHAGALFYTIGSRHGFTVNKQSTHEIPRYVVSKDMHANTITVAPHATPKTIELEKDTIDITDTNWIRGINPESTKKYDARIRYRQKLFPCKVRATDSGYQVYSFDTHERAAAGQSLVVYDGEECLGGGIVH